MVSGSNNFQKLHLPRNGNILFLKTMSLLLQEHPSPIYTTMVWKDQIGYYNALLLDIKLLSLYFSILTITPKLGHAQEYQFLELFEQRSGLLATKFPSLLSIYKIILSCIGLKLPIPDVK